MRLVHISDVHVYDPDSGALQRARHWGKVAIAAGVFAGVMKAGSLGWARDVQTQYPRSFRLAQALLLAGVSFYVVRKIIDYGHRLAYRSLAGEGARRILEADLQSMSFDHLLVTGDVALTPSQAEFERAAEILAPFWDRLHIVPGNHDIPHIEGSSGDFNRTFAARLEPFPIIRDLGEGVALVGIDSTVRGALQDPWALISNARGRITDQQLHRLRVEAPGHGMRIMAMHHHLRPTPAGPGGLIKKIFMGPVRGADYVLRNMDALGVDLVLHGHQHWNYFGRGFLCAGTSALQPEGGTENPTYNIYDFDDGALIRAVRREIRGEKVVEEELPLDRILPAGRPPAVTS